MLEKKGKFNLDYFFNILLPFCVISQNFKVVNWQFLNYWLQAQEIFIASAQWNNHMYIFTGCFVNLYKKMHPHTFLWGTEFEVRLFLNNLQVQIQTSIWNHFLKKRIIFSALCLDLKLSISI